MGNCAKCNAEIPDGTTFCPNHIFDPGKQHRIDQLPDFKPDLEPIEIPGGGGGDGLDRPEDPIGPRGADRPSFGGSFSGDKGGGGFPGGGGSGDFGGGPI